MQISNYCYGLNRVSPNYKLNLGVNADENFRFNAIQNFRGKTDVFVKAANNVAEAFDAEAAKQLLDIFNRKLNKMPKGLNLTLSQTNDSVLSFSKDIGNNVTVKAVKKVAENKHDKYLYVVFREFDSGVLKDTFALDMNSGELIKLRPDGRVSIFKDELIKYRGDSTDTKYVRHCKKISEYANAIFGNNTSKTKAKCKIANKVTVEETDVKKSWRIASSKHDDLPASMQKDVKEINETFLRYTDLIAARRGLSSKIVQLKEEYPNMICINRKQKNLMFKYRNLESLAVLYSKSNNRFTRIIHTNSNGIETHFLIDNAQKVVSNLNRKRPWIMPEKFRYMTQEEIETSGIKNHIAFLKKQLTDYYNYMEKNIGGAEVVHRCRFRNSEEDLNNFMDKMIEQISANLQGLHDDIEKRADGDANEIVSRYFKALAENFDKYAEENLHKFRKKFAGYIEKSLNKVNAGKQVTADHP